jgi:glutamine amidotransferase
MCELFAMSARYPATVDFSLKELARHGGISAHHRDGWGIGYVQERDAWIVKEAGPASASDLVRYVGSHHVSSRVVISHVRRATSGVSYENTHPFSRELGGRRHLFAHNGELPGLVDSPLLRTGRFRPMGGTDSEQAFCALLARLEDPWLESACVPGLDERLAIVEAFASDLRRLGPANFLFWDGEVLFVHGHRRRAPGAPRASPPGIVMLERTCPFEGTTLAEGGVRVVPEFDEQRVLLVASVPLSDERWEPLAEGELLVVSGGTVVTRGVPPSRSS